MSNNTQDVRPMFIFESGKVCDVDGAHFKCVRSFHVHSRCEIDTAIQRGDLIPLPAYRKAKPRSETRAWLESHGWRFMGYNPAHKVAYYANLNLNTVQTFPQHTAEEITRRVMFGVKVGQDMGILFNHLGIMTPPDYSACAVQQNLYALAAMGIRTEGLNLHRLWDVMKAVMQQRKVEQGNPWTP